MMKSFLAPGSNEVLLQFVPPTIHGAIYCTERITNHLGSFLHVWVVSTTINRIIISTIKMSDHCSDDQQCDVIKSECYDDYITGVLLPRQPIKSISKHWI